MLSWDGEVWAALVTGSLLATGYLVREHWHTRRLASALATEIGIKLKALHDYCNAAAISHAEALVSEGKIPAFIIESGGDPIFDDHAKELTRLPRHVIKRITAYYRSDRYLSVALDFVNSDQFCSDDFDRDRRLRYLSLVYPSLVREASRSGFRAYLALSLWLELNWLEKAALRHRFTVRLPLHRAPVRRVVGLARKRFPWSLRRGPTGVVPQG